MSNDDLKRRAIHFAIDILIDRNFKNLSFMQSYAAGTAAKWIVDNYGSDIWHFFTDTVELLTIINKSKIRMEAAREDYHLLQIKKARRIADKILNSYS